MSQTGQRPQHNTLTINYLRRNSIYDSSLNQVPQNKKRPYGSQSRTIPYLFVRNHAPPIPVANVLHPFRTQPHTPDSRCEHFAPLSSATTTSLPPRRKWKGWLAQVERVFGAGVEKGCGPAPQNRLLCVPVAQVPHPKAHLRQESSTPAPKTCRTCAKTMRDLRHEFKAPAPIPTDTYAENPQHGGENVFPDNCDLRRAAARLRARSAVFLFLQPCYLGGRPRAEAVRS